MWLKGLTLEGEVVRNPSVNLSPTLARNEKVDHQIVFLYAIPFNSLQIVYKTHIC